MSKPKVGDLVRLKHRAPASDPGCLLVIDCHIRRKDDGWWYEVLRPTGQLVTHHREELRVVQPIHDKE